MLPCIVGAARGGVGRTIRHISLCLLGGMISAEFAQMSPPITAFLMDSADRKGAMAVVSCEL